MTLPDGTSQLRKIYPSLIFINVTLKQMHVMMQHIYYSISIDMMQYMILEEDQ